MPAHRLFAAISTAFIAATSVAPADTISFTVEPGL